MMRHCLVITAAGKGDRFGGDKLAADIGGKRVLDWAFDGLLDFFDWSGVVVVGGDGKGREVKGKVEVEGGGESVGVG